MATLLPPAHPDVRVWLVDLDAGDTTASLAVLSADEAARAERFVFDHHRRRFAACRAALRRILADELRATPAALSFAYNASGKPELHLALDGLRGAGRGVNQDAPSLRFNVSHSDRYALVATTTAGAVGVDIEKTRPIEDVLRLARTAFSTNELETLTALPAGVREAAFFAGWTRKEAYIKARGEGIGRLAAIEVALTPGEPPRLIRVDDQPGELERWSIQALSPVHGFAAAVCMEGRGHRFSPV